MESNEPAVYAGPEGKKALQSVVQAIGSGFTLVHVLFDVVDTIKKQVSMSVPQSYYITDCLDRQMF